MRHGVGIVDHIEDRIVGLKVRDIYEVPAAAILLKAHKELERLCGHDPPEPVQAGARPEVGVPRLRGAVVGAAARGHRGLHRAGQRARDGHDRAEAVQGQRAGGDAREPERGLRRAARDVRGVRRAVLPAGVAGVHRAVVAAVAHGPAAARVGGVGCGHGLQAARDAGLEGREWFLRRKYGAVMAPKPLLAGGLVRCSSASASSRASAARSKPDERDDPHGAGMPAAAPSESIRGVEPSSSVPALEGLAVEAVEWLPSGSDAGLVRVRGRWTDPARREPELPALGPAARGGGAALRVAARRALRPRPGGLARDVPRSRRADGPRARGAVAVVGERRARRPAGARARLRAAGRSRRPAAPPEPGGEVIDRAVLAERRARRAEAAERDPGAARRRGAQGGRGARAAQRGAGAAPRGAAGRRDAGRRAEPPAGAPRRRSGAERRAAPPRWPRRSARSSGCAASSASSASACAGASCCGRPTPSRSPASARSRARARAAGRARGGAGDRGGGAQEAAAAREQAAEQVALAARRASADAAAVRTRAAEELAARARRHRRGARGARGDRARPDGERAAHAATGERLATRERELSAIGAELASVRAELATVRQDAAQRAAELERRLSELDAALAAERRAHERPRRRETALAGSPRGGRSQRRDGRPRRPRRGARPRARRPGDAHRALAAAQAS